MTPSATNQEQGENSDVQGVPANIHARRPSTSSLGGTRSLRRMSSDRGLDDLEAGDSNHSSSFMDNDVTSVYSFASGNSESSATKRQKRYLQMQVANEEEERIKWTKRGMIAVLVMAAIATSLATYFLLKDAQEQDFEKQFRNYASEIVSVATQNVENSFGSIDAFANSITSSVISSGQVFPNVTIEEYTSKAIRVANLAANARLVTYAPVVTAQDRLGFEEYARQALYPQLQQDLDYLNINEVTAEEIPTIPQKLAYFNLTAKKKFPEPEGAPGPFLVNWQRYPLEVKKGRVFVMNNMMRIPTIRSAVTAANQTFRPTLTFLEALLGIESQVIQPVFDQIVPPHKQGTQADTRKMVGVIWIVLNWANYFQNLLPSNVGGIYVTLKSSCGFSATFLVNGLEAENLGIGDLHDPAYDHLVYRDRFYDLASSSDEEGENDQEIFLEQEEQGTQSDNKVCIDKLVLELYPSDDFKEDFENNEPIFYAVAVACIFAFTLIVFLGFDWNVRQRQNKVEERLMAQDKIVSNLFPKSIQDRLYNVNIDTEGSDGESLSNNTHHRELQRYVEDPEIFKSKPIADLYLETTVMFADIAGFTAWSSTRAPSQVFKLLETIYGAFDKLAHRHGVFKVETIGDCYVAVAGLPTPDPEHAINMARFARDCMSKMKELTRRLEVTLGPDTGDLCIRVGLHSGQCTAGVLRGERSRFQLFGDTVNTASRMESLGSVKMIHMSGVTAELLRSQGFGQWVRERNETVHVAGKGEMHTFWLETKSMTKSRESKEEKAGASGGNMAESSKVYFEEDELHVADGLDKEQRLIEWLVDTLSDSLRNIQAARNMQQNKRSSSNVSKEEREIGKGDDTVLEECKDVIELPKVSVEDLAKRSDPETIHLDPEVVDQLRRFITVLANLYPNNKFHNFEHAAHVTASVDKLLGRIVKIDPNQQDTSLLEASDLADHSYGITSDPLTHLAVVFSAIIHDVDHPGVGNAVLVKEKVPLAIRYKNKSVAEQNSVDLAWELLMSSEYDALRACIYSNPSELRRFRQLVVNSVMATDICDKELNALRKDRWNKAFAEQVPGSDVRNGKATIVIEHLIQASDVSHMMQHWHIYRKWNECFFFEMMEAYEAGRVEKDPREEWYDGEIGFFDFYVIPLAKKLDTCGVFGVSSDEYLGYASSNRDEWKRRGKDILQEYIANWNEAKNQSEEETPPEEFAEEPANGEQDNV